MSLASLDTTQSTIASLLPSLPGYRSAKKIQTSGNVGKKTMFDYINGERVLKESNNESDSILDDNMSATSFSIGTTRKKKNDDYHGFILRFHAYFEEFPAGLPPGARQIRRCDILYYLEDHTIKVVEKQVSNSGVTQGVLCRRQPVVLQHGAEMTIHDLRFGEATPIFGVEYFIYDTDVATRNFLIENDVFYEEDLTPFEPPEDYHTQYRLSLQPDSTAGEWGKFHSKKNDNKTYADASRGVLTDNSLREGFNKYGTSTLKFHCVWDNRNMLYGDKLEFSLNYYLADDTIEILGIPSPNSGTSESKLKLLKRGKLPKDFVTMGNLGQRPKKDECVEWQDLYIGCRLEVYGRCLLVCEADSRTRDFYIENNLPLGEGIFEEVPPVIIQKREIPPPTGFGSEEDSMRSVSGSLIPGPAPVKKLGENKILSFHASLLSGGIDDVDRRFVISYYVTDKTIKILEPPVRNSGFTGGVFLSRREVKKQSGSIVTHADLYIGCHFQVLKHVFLLLDASDSTLKWLEDPIRGLPRSSYYFILEKIRPKAFEDAKSGRLHDKFEVIVETKGLATEADLTKIIDSYDLLFDDLDYGIVLHEIRTIVRGAGNKEPTFNYDKFIEQIIHPTDEFK